MKRILALFIYLFTFSPFHLIMAQEGSLFVVHTSDTHSCIEPISPNFSDTAQANKGGYLRRVVLLEQLRKEHPQDLLLLDCGDFSQGSVYYNLYKGEIEVKLMNLMKYDACTIGNHEFDFGLENLARLMKMAEFPFVCCNYDFTGTPVEGLVKPYVIIKREGVKIGVFGLAPKMKGLVSDKNCTGVKYSDPARVALETATMLKEKEKCDMVICISHLGWNSNRGEDDQYMIHGSRNIDLVLGGHTHTYFTHLEYENNMDGKPVPVDQNGKGACFIGRLVVDLK